MLSRNCVSKKNSIKGETGYKIHPTCQRIPASEIDLFSTLSENTDTNEFAIRFAVFDQAPGLCIFFARRHAGGCDPMDGMFEIIF